MFVTRWMLIILTLLLSTFTSPTTYEQTDLPGVILFSAFAEDGTSSLLMMKANGSDAFLLAHNEEGAWYNAYLSPDRSQIAHTYHYPAGTYNVFLINADGTSNRRISDDWRSSVHGWLDNEHIIISYTRGPDDLSRALFSVNVQTGSAHQLTDWHDSCCDVTISPDRRFIAYTAWNHRTTPQLFVHTISTGEVITIGICAGDYSCHSWNPISDSVVFANAYGTISRSSIDGRDLQQLIGRPQHHGMKPVWSPDGTQIAFTSLDHGPTQIYVMADDGSDVVQITNSRGMSVNPSWSPDGRYLIWGESPSVVPTGNPEDSPVYFYLDLSSGNTQPLFDGDYGRIVDFTWYDLPED